MNNLALIQNGSKSSFKGTDKGNERLKQIFGSDDDFLEPKKRLITPEIAKELLKMNKVNRKLRDSHVDWLAAQMKLGYWLYTGQVVPVDVDGNLCNMQHTLHAVVKCGVSIKAIIQAGLDPRVIDVLDTGIARTPGDVLDMNGVKHANVVAAAIRRVLNFHNKEFSAAGGGQGGTASLKVDEDNELIANIKILEICKENQSYWEALAATAQTLYGFERLKPPSFIAFVMHLFNQKHVDKSKDFCHKVFSRIGLQPDTPEYTVSRKLQHEKNSDNAYPGRAHLFWIIDAWNKSRAGRKMKQCRSYKSSIEIPEIK